MVSTEVVCATAPEEPAAKLQRKLLSKKAPAKSKGKKADTAQPTLMETLNKSAEKRRNEATTSQDENNDILPGKAKKVGSIECNFHICKIQMFEILHLL